MQELDNVLTHSDEIVQKFREGLMHRIATRDEVPHEPFFEKLVDSVIRSGVVDITGWNKIAVKVLLRVCSEREGTFTFVNDGMSISFVRYPEGPIFDQMAEAIASCDLSQ
ncbi:MAG: hypothetical protein RTU30_13145 [Candidatus Thorarchaeota archaeon]